MDVVNAETIAEWLEGRLPVRHTIISKSTDKLRIL